MALTNGNLLLVMKSGTTLVLLAAATTLMLAVAAADKPLPPHPQAKRNCQERCGNLTVPYPFGIGDGCYIPLKGQENQFNLTCDDSMKPPTLNWTGSALVISDFTISEGLLEAMNYISKDCYDKNGRVLDSVKGPYAGVDLRRPFSLSGPRNTFVAVGCDTYSVFKGYCGGEQVFMTGCMSVCTNITTVDQNSCSGVGCCLQNQIPDGLNLLKVELGSYYDHAEVLNYNPCSYAFAVKAGYFNFRGTRSFEQLKNTQQVPVIFNWQIGNQTCKEAEENGEDYACKENTTCHNQDKGPYSGYFCSCKQGYEGNPYIGCRDIDECLADIDPCGNGTCHNSPGSYSCKCKSGFKNDGLQKCVPNPTGNNTPLKISLGISICFFVLLVVIFVLYRECKRRQFYKLRNKYFEDNGGRKLQQILDSQKGSLAPVKIFTEEEVKRATKNYDEKEKIGEGGYGIVYKGELDDKRVVAIKTSKMNARVEGDQFINEVIVLSAIIHKHVVKLVGCCLETKTPMLVYEYVSNGTLYDHIHRRQGKGPLSFAQRVKIAVEAATALSYLHHSINPQIVHRDVKATNILLDEKLTAKVSDFGASKLVPEDKTQLSTLVQGTLGYLDPQYLLSHTLTEKSDVYSFGVVLVELLTSEKAVREDKPEAEKNLANVFLSTMENERPLDPILDHEIVTDGNREMIEKVAELAKKCLCVKGDERPGMIEVEGELRKILETLLAKQPELGKKQPESTDQYIVEVTTAGGGDGGSTGISSMEYDASMQTQAQKPFADGR